MSQQTPKELQLKAAELRLMMVISKWIDTETINDHPFEYIGDHLVTLMTKAAFAVIESSTDIQAYYYQEGLVK